MTETRSTSTTRVRAHRARKSRGLHSALIEVSEAQVDRLADEGYLDGDNTAGGGSFPGSSRELVEQTTGLRPSPRYAARDANAVLAVLARRAGGCKVARSLGDIIPSPLTNQSTTPDSQAQASISSKTRRKAGSGARHMVRYVSTKGSQATTATY